MIIKAKQYKTTRWSGGTTTQLFIFPESADYQKRDFLFRISTATVETEESTFTSLPGYKRILMVLAGSLLIKHKGQYEKKLKKFEQDTFDGGWKTIAVGKVTDFNLMMAESVCGDLETIVLKKDEERRIGGKQVFVYVFKGSIKISEAVAETGDFISFDDEILVVAIRSSQLVIAALMPASSEG